jgi:hypothetical protein
MQNFKKIKFSTFFLLSLTLFTSCISSKKLLSPHNDPTTSRFEKNINGVYKNIDTTNSIGTSSLLNVLYEKGQTKFPDDWTDLQVHLLYEDQKLYVKSFLRDSLVYENEIWGHVHNNFFLSNRKFLVIPLLLFNLAKESRQIVFIDENGMLHATNRGYYWWFIATGNNGSSDSENYQRYGQYKKVGELPSPF